MNPDRKVRDAAMKFMGAPSLTDCIRLFATDSERQTGEMLEWLDKLEKPMRARADQAAYAGFAERRSLLSTLHKVAAERARSGAEGAEPLEEYLTRHPDVQAFFEHARERLAIPEEIGRMFSYAASAQDRYRETKEPQHLREAVRLWNEVLAKPDFTSTPVRFQGTVLAEQGDNQRQAFESSASPDELRSALELWSRYIEQQTDPSARVDAVSRCAVALIGSAAMHARTTDFDLIMDWHRRMLTDNGAPAASSLKSAGDRCRQLYRSTQAPLLLDYAAQWHREAVVHLPAGHPLRADYLDTLGLDLGLKLEGSPSEELAEETVAVRDEALSAGMATLETRKDYLADYAINLADAYWQRFEISKRLPDMERAVDAYDQALNIAPPDYPNWAEVLSQASAANLILFELTHNTERLRKAIDLRRHAIAAAPQGSPEWTAFAEQMASLLLESYRNRIDPGGLDRAIEVLEQCLVIGSLDPIGRFRVRLVLASLLGKRYQRDRSEQDFDSSLSLLQMASSEAGGLRARQAKVFVTEAELLKIRYSTLGDVDALEKANALLSQVAMLNARELIAEVPADLRSMNMPLIDLPGESNEEEEKAWAEFPREETTSGTPLEQPTVPAVLSAEGPKEIAIGSTSFIRVRMERQQAAAPLEHSVTAEIDPVQKIAIVVTVQSDLLELLDPWVKVVDPPAAGAPFDCEFRIRGKAAGTTDVAVQFIQGQSLLGSLTFEIEVSEVASADVQHATAAMLAADAADSGNVMLLIHEARDGDSISFRYLVTSAVLGFNFQVFESPRFLEREGSAGSTPLAYVRSIYRQVVERALLNRDDLRNFQSELQGIGTDLCRQLFPSEFIRVLWEERDNIQAIQVVSWEPYIPWELVRLQHPDKAGKDGVDPRYFAEYPLIRTLSGKMPPLRLGAADWKYMVAEFPHGSFERADGELQFLATVLPELGVKTVEVPAEPNKLLDLLGEGMFDVLHVAGHGEAALERIEDAVLILGDRQTPDGIKPVSIRPGTVAGAADLTRRRPLIFFNACETGRQAPSLTDLGGWPRAFFQVGAGAYVGTSWAVRERPAVTFAQAFYKTLLEGQTLAAAARAAREEAKKLGDASWLAFAVYGCPSARFHHA